MADTGFVKSKIINLPKTLSLDELNRIVFYLNRRLDGLTIDKITSELIVELRRELYNHITFLEEALTLMEKILLEDERRVYLSGTTNILNQPEFENIENKGAAFPL